MAEIDVYRDWLSITDTDRPLNHYQLLRLTKFEDDLVKIRKNYRQMNAHVRKYSTGAYARQSQELLNELAKAMLCLTDVRRKSEYDLTLGRQAAKSEGRRTLEELLLSRQVIDAAKLKKARDYADAIGLEVRDALIQQKIVAAEVLMPLYAESIGVPYLDLSDVVLDPALLARVPAMLARAHSCVPVMIDGGQLLVASPNQLKPDTEDELRLRVGMPVRTVLCTPVDVNAAVNQHYPREKAQAEMAAQASGATAPKPKPAKAGEVSEAKPKAAGDPKIRLVVAVMLISLTFFATGFLEWHYFARMGAALAVGGLAFGVMNMLKI